MRVAGTHYRTVWLEGTTVQLIDQRRLPFDFTIRACRTYRETAEAIRDMTVRGAGAIGVAAGFAMAQAALAAGEEDFEAALREAAGAIRATRPTARNLFYAVDRVLEATRTPGAVAQRKQRAVEAAQAVSDEDAAAGERIGQIGQDLLRDDMTILTHCNAGWLAFADWGTALAPVYVGHRAGRRLHVIVTETRPRGQGAKLTAWELAQEGVPHTLVADTAVGRLLQQRRVDLVIVGADRVAANGDVANKIGTYQIAVLARAHRVPFYVALPTSTIDPACPDGASIPIEERSDEEVLWVTGTTDRGGLERVQVAPPGTAARNWAFDVTPAALVSGLLTERGRVAANRQAIEDLLGAGASMGH